MQAMAIRRFLQPSPTLRWHPWAPLVAGLLLLAFVFVLGVQWGYSVGRREVQLGANHYAGLVRAEMLWKQSRPATDLMRKSGSIDAAVRRYLRQQEQPPTLWERTRAAAERWAFYRGRNPYDYPRDAIVSLAEFRLKELGGSAPLWQATASYCDEIGRPISGMDLAPGARGIAADYSKLLGRTIDAAQVAPVVPNMRCEPKGSVQ